MIELYAARTSNGVRARIALEECRLAYNLHVLDLAKGQQRTAAFLALNPSRKIPVMVDSEGPGGEPLTLSQSSAILLYCAEKTDRFLPRDPARRPACLQALMSVGTDLTPTFGAMLAIMRSNEPHGPSIEVFKSRWHDYLGVWDWTLSRQRYCIGDELTIADFSLYAGYAIPKDLFPELCGNTRNVDRWAEEIAARPGVRRAMAF